MSNSADNPNPYLINRFGTASSRITRLNYGAKNNQTSNPPNDQTDSNESSKIPKTNQYDKLMPHKPSELSGNVLFQDMDRSSPPKDSPKKYQRQKQS